LVTGQWAVVIILTVVTMDHFTKLTRAPYDTMETVLGELDLPALKEVYAVMGIKHPEETPAFERYERRTTSSYIVKVRAAAEKIRAADAAAKAKATAATTAQTTHHKGAYSPIHGMNPQGKRIDIRPKKDRERSDSHNVITGMRSLMAALHLYDAKQAELESAKQTQDC
jgi:hypothetical protein